MGGRSHSDSEWNNDTSGIMIDIGLVILLSQAGLSRRFNWSVSAWTKLVSDIVSDLKAPLLESRAQEFVVEHFKPSGLSSSGTEIRIWASSAIEVVLVLYGYPARVLSCYSTLERSLSFLASASYHSKCSFLHQTVQDSQPPSPYGHHHSTKYIYYYDLLFLHGLQYIFRHR